jgi:uncharacterized protein (TIGR02145 family)
MKNSIKTQLAKLTPLTAAIGLAFIFTISCGEHGLEEIFESDISSSSPVANVSSSSQQQNSDSHPGAVVGPLLKTKWAQGSPYNDLFPIVNGERKVTNCETTAKVQLMAFHKYPARGKGESSVLQTTGGNFKVPLTSLDVAYDWNNMLDEYTTANPGNEQQRLAVATLMYHYGLAKGIGNYYYRILTEHFGYDKSLQCHNREYYNDDEWAAIIRQQLDLRLPVYYEGRSNANDDPEDYSTDSFHGFVVDGYDNAGKFHFNWGWGGARDGWHSLSDIDAGNGKRYDNSNVMCINIKPDAGSIGSNEMGLSKFTTSKGTVTQNVQFTVTATIRSFGIFPSGQAGAALVNNSGNIVAVIGMIDPTNSMSLSSTTRTINCSVPTTVNPGQYSLRIVTKMGGETAWKIVTQSLRNVPKSIPFNVVTDANICPDASSIVSGTFTDSRDGKKYKTVKINEQTWMAENLNYNITGGKCHGEGGQVIDEENKIVTLSTAEIQANCDKYGRLYNWETAMKACPSGWHLPSNEEWDKLIYYVDGICGKERTYESPYRSYTAGEYLKAQSGWTKNGNGTDNFGFSALPGGQSYPSGSFSWMGEKGYWWSSSEDGNSRAYNREIEYDDGYVSGSGNDKNYLHSIRCIKD